MKRILLVINMLLILHVTTVCQDHVSRGIPEKSGDGNTKEAITKNKKYSPYSKFAVKSLKDMDSKSLGVLLDEKPFLLPAVSRNTNSLYINGLMKCEQGADLEELERMGLIFRSEVNDIYAVSIPAGAMQKLNSIPSIEYLQIDQEIHIRLDSARELTGVKRVQQGLDLPAAYTGDGVIIGVLDFGFDLTHPTFYDTEGQTLRIEKVWNTIDESGNPPAGFLYGSEYSGEAEILAQLYTETESSHGTHVAGIAAGSGIGTDGKFTGMAPNSNLVLVQLGGGMSDVTDGLNYVFNYAESVDKPAVINMSLGTHLGPHDGTSLSDQVIDALSGPGRIIVGAAGNEGITSLHASYSFTDDTVQTFVQFEESFSYYGSGMIDIWGDPDSDMTLALNIFDYDGFYVDWTPYYQASDQVEIDTIFVINSDTIEVYIYSEASNPFNNRPNFFVWINNPLTDHVISLELASPNSTIHLWNNGLGSGAPLTDEFPNYGALPGFLNGDIDYTVGEVGGTAHEIITVGAYTSKNTYTSLYGIEQLIPFYDQVGRIAEFTSRGPTLDGRIKPEICAPGNVVISSVNSFDLFYDPDLNTEVVSGVSDGTDSWYFASMQGTSMATPVVTGIVALWLEANPLLTPGQIKDILANTALTDEFTGSIPSGGNNSWGYGKIDAHSGMKALLGSLPGKPEISVEGATSFCDGDSAVLSGPAGNYSYFWSTQDTTRSLTVLDAGNYSLKIMDENGWISPGSDTVEITVWETPETPLISFMINILSTLATEEKQWYNMSGPISGETGGTYQPTENGDYYLVVQNSFGCTATSDTLSIELVGTGAYLEPEPYNIYPVPGDGKLFIENGGYGKKNIEIRSSGGQLVLKTESLEELIELDISALQPGVFMISIEDESGILTGKFIKQ